jgi:tetratricopeptide (TPR) repeat protein/GTPase SAR1 family protein
LFNQSLTGASAVATGAEDTASKYNHCSFSSSAALPEPFSPQSRLGLPVRNLSFTGRVDELAAIAHSLSQAQQGVIAKNVVGLGGVGKTQLVTEYVHQSIAKNKYAFIAWLDGAQPERAYRSLGEYLGLEFELKDLETQCIAKVEQQLIAHYPSLLLVWDDVKDQGQMLPYLASVARLNAHCLITSRAQYWEEEANLSMIRLDVFNEADALTFQRQRFTASNGLFEEVAAKDLAHNVGYLPLALAQAAAYIVRQRQIYRQDYSLNDYLSAYTSAQVTMRKEFYDTALAVVQDNHTKTVWTTWYLSLVALRAENPQAVSLIELCAYLNAQEIQERLLSLLSDTPADEVQRCIEALLAYSLIERLMGNQLPAIKIHQLLQAVIRLHLKEEPLPPAIPLSLPVLEDAAQNDATIPEALVIRQYLTDKISQWQFDQQHEIFNYLPSNVPPSFEGLEAAHTQKGGLRKLIIPALHNNRDHQIIALLLNRLDKTFQYDKRQRRQLRAVHILFAPHVKAVCSYALTAEVGEPNAAHLLFHLGSLAHYLKDAKEGWELFQKILPYYELFYSNYSVLGKALHNLGYAYGALGDHKKSKHLLKRALRIFELDYGPEHAEIANILSNLAYAYGALGNYEKSKRLLQRSLRIKERDYGLEHVEVADLLTNLANAYGDLGNHQEKKRLLRRALKIHERNYGPEHVNVAGILDNLAAAHGALGDHKESKRLIQRALMIFERNYGPISCEVAYIVNNLAFANEDLGEFALAQNNYHRALRIYQHFFGEAHPELGMIFLSLAILHFKQEELSIAWAYLKKAHAIFFHHPNCGPNHPYTQRAVEQLEEWAPRMQIFQGEAPFCPRTQHLGEIGSQAFQDKDYNKAIESWQITLPFVTAQSFLFSTNKLDAVLLHERIGDAYREQGGYVQAIESFTQAHTQLAYLIEQKTEVYLRIAGKKSACEMKYAANHIHQIGITHYKAGNWAQAIIAFQEGLEKNERFFAGKLHADVASSYWCLSSCYLQQTNYTQACAHVYKTYIILQALFGENAELTHITQECLNFCRIMLAQSTSESSTRTLNPQGSSNIAPAVRNSCNFYRTNSPASPTTASEVGSHRPK